jgi:prevent-host-death family protein
VEHELNEQEAETHLSRLLERVERGAEFVITRAGRPVARLVPYHTQRGPRTPGGWEGRVTIAEDFESLPDEVSTAFRGERS